MKIADVFTTAFGFVRGTAPATPAAGNLVLYAKTDGKMYQKDESGVESALGITNFLGLTDTPDAYTAMGGKVVSVKADVSGLEFTTPSGGSGTTVNKVRKYMGIDLL